MRFLLLTLVLAGCAGPTTDDVCGDDAPDELGRACSVDGECGTWLVCGSECELPPAVSGEGGEVATISGSTTAEVRVEVARGDLARARGLSERPCLADGWGMIIEFPEPGPHQITTESMLFDLDIAMLDASGEIIALVESAPAGGKALYGADAPVSAVLELPAGLLQLAVGDVVDYPSASGG